MRQWPFACGSYTKWVAPRTVNSERWAPEPVANKKSQVKKTLMALEHLCCHHKARVHQAAKHVLEDGLDAWQALHLVEGVLEAGLGGIKV